MFQEKSAEEELVELEEISRIISSQIFEEIKRSEDKSILLSRYNLSMACSEQNKLDPSINELFIENKCLIFTSF